MRFSCEQSYEYSEGNLANVARAKRLSVHATCYTPMMGQSGNVAVPLTSLVWRVLHCLMHTVSQDVQRA